MLTALTLGAAAEADVKQAAADGFLIEHRYAIAAAPDAVWRALLQPGRWWPAEHTWSGVAANLSLSAEAGACFCERWDGGAVEHGRVVMARPGSLLRISAALGPMQEMAVTGVLTIKLEPDASGTRATVTYRVSGDASHQLDKLAPVVNDVLNLQFGGLAKFAASVPPANSGP
jgi:uncharacterized protein YndB with AHSA1/START domain